MFGAQKRVRKELSGLLCGHDDDDAATTGASTAAVSTFYLQVDAANYPVTHLMLSTSATQPLIASTQAAAPAKTSSTTQYKPHSGSFVSGVHSHHNASNSDDGSGGAEEGSSFHHHLHQERVRGKEHEHHLTSPLLKIRLALLLHHLQSQQEKPAN